jgi:hypothetical protein
MKDFVQPHLKSRDFKSGCKHEGDWMCSLYLSASSVRTYVEIAGSRYGGG